MARANRLQLQSRGAELAMQNTYEGDTKDFNKAGSSILVGEGEPSPPIAKKIKRLLRKQKIEAARALLQKIATGDDSNILPETLARKLTFLVKQKELQLQDNPQQSLPRIRSSSQLVANAYQLCKKNKLKKATRLVKRIDILDINEPSVIKKLHFVCRKSFDFRSASQLSLRLHDLYPANLDYLAQLIEDLLSIANFSACREYIARASVENPRFLKLRAQIDNAEALCVSHKTRSTQLRSSRPECDVIAIASDEAPYLPDFIHHYIYLGFKNIFIGVNNSTDATLALAKKISQAYSQVHIFDVDESMRRFNQRGAYTELWGKAISLSTSTHCMFVDIDEFWIGSPFPTTISDYLSRYPGAEVLTFNWVNCFETREFSAPLDFEDVDLSVKSNCKSIVSYSSNILELRCHSPILAADTSAPHCIDPLGSLVRSSYGPIGFTLPTSFSVTAKDIETAELSFVFHRLTRSETEYCYRLLKPHANQLKGHLQSKKTAPFKANRFGYRNIQGLRLPDKSISKLFPSGSIEAYHNSLSQFLVTCDVENDLYVARKAINHEAIIERLQTIDPLEIKNSQKIWTKSFSDTVFIDYLAERMLASDSTTA